MRAKWPVLGTRWIRFHPYQVLLTSVIMFGVFFVFMAYLEPFEHILDPNIWIRMLQLLRSMLLFIAIALLFLGFVSITRYYSPLRPLPPSELPRTPEQPKLIAVPKQRTKAKARSSRHRSNPTHAGTVDAQQTNALMRAFAFTADDLAANRKGRLSPQQQAKGRGEIKRNLVGLSMLPVMLAIMFVASGTPLRHLTMFIPMGLTALIVLGISSWISAKGQVSIVEGIGQRAILRTRHGRTYVFKVSYEHFYVVKKRWDRLQDDEYYRVYYLNRLGALEILSIEVINLSN